MKQNLKIQDLDIAYCGRCNTLYLSFDLSEYFYWETRHGFWRKPCKKCLSAYNKTSTARATRYAANKNYAKSEKGRLAQKRAKVKYLNKKEELAKWKKKQVQKKRQQNLTILWYFLLILKLLDLERKTCVQMMLTKLGQSK